MISSAKCPSRNSFAIFILLLHRHDVLEFPRLLVICLGRAALEVGRRRFVGGIAVLELDDGIPGFLSYKPIISLLFLSSLSACYSGSPSGDALEGSGGLPQSSRGCPGSYVRCARRAPIRHPRDARLVG